jgi:hypothetical protein
MLSTPDARFRTGRARAAETDAPAPVRYIGVSDWSGRDVCVERDGVRVPLHACGDELIAGFSWGCRGIAPRELARAILADATGSPALAERYCRDFTHGVIADLPRWGFELDGADVLRWLDRASAPAAAVA